MFGWLQNLSWASPRWPSTVAITPGTVQLPRFYQPLEAPAISLAHKYTFFAPPNPELNVIARLSVKILPLTVSLLSAALIEHWLFCKVTLSPIARTALCRVHKRDRIRQFHSSPLLEPRLPGLAADFACCFSEPE